MVQSVKTNPLMWLIKSTEHKTMMKTVLRPPFQKLCWRHYYSVSTCWGVVSFKSRRRRSRSRARVSISGVTSLPFLLPLGCVSTEEHLIEPISDPQKHNQHQKASWAVRRDWALMLVVVLIARETIKEIGSKTCKICQRRNKIKSINV